MTQESGKCKLCGWAGLRGTKQNGGWTRDGSAPTKKEKNNLTQKQIETYRIKFIAALFAKAKHEKQVSIIGDEMSKLQ